MSTKHLVIMILSIVLTGFFCTSSSLTTKDKKPTKASSLVVKDDGKTKKDAVLRKNIYICENMLYVKTPLINDLIYVYNTSGLCIDKFVKETELVVKDASAYPSGELTITNGKDLTIKVVK
jgi:hypothetical protein